MALSLSLGCHAYLGYVDLGYLDITMIGIIDNKHQKQIRGIRQLQDEPIS
jgi:hypothetical protein